MALIATVGSPDANSYVTVQEAAAYFSHRTHSEAWGEFDEQPAALCTASQMLDWYIKWKGIKASAEQAMLWPRTEVSRNDGTLVADDIIPPELKVAVYELALSSLDADRTEDNPLAGIDQVKAGTLMVKASAGGYDSTSEDTIPEKVWNILSDLYNSGDISVVRLVRA